MSDIVCIKIFRNRMDAEIAKGALAAQEIYSYLDADDAGGMYPFPLSGRQKGVRLFVQQKNEAKAKRIVDI